MDIENLISTQRAFFLSQRTKEPEFRIDGLKKLDGLSPASNTPLQRGEIEMDQKIIFLTGN